jgi:Xaa-Pro aminopeptidase
MSVHAARRDRLLAKIRDEGFDALFVTSPVNVSYLTGFTGEATYLVLTPRKTLLVSDGRFRVQLAEECPGLDVVIRPPGQQLPDAAAETLGKLGIHAVGFDSGHLTVAEFEAIREKAGPLDWKPAAGSVEALRAVKDDGELARIRRAIELAQTAFDRFRSNLRVGSTEKELHDAMEFHVRSLGGRTTAFPTIVAVGARAALPHAPPTQHRLAESPFFLLDWGADEGPYKSDLTRVLWAGKPSGPLFDKLVKVAGVVQKARQAALAQMRPGVEVQTVDAAARQVIADAGFGEYFNHGLGHGLGMQIHEAPFMRPGNPAKLEAGMVVTLEPGIYLPDELGVRIEDDILIAPDGPEMLTSLPQLPEELVVSLL